MTSTTTFLQDEQSLIETMKSESDKEHDEKLSHTVEALIELWKIVNELRGNEKIARTRTSGFAVAVASLQEFVRKLGCETHQFLTVTESTTFEISMDAMNHYIRFLLENWKIAHETLLEIVSTKYKEDGKTSFNGYFLMSIASLNTFNFICSVIAKGYQF